VQNQKDALTTLDVPPHLNQDLKQADSIPGKNNDVESATIYSEVNIPFGHLQDFSLSYSPSEMQALFDDVFGSLTGSDMLEDSREPIQLDGEDCLTAEICGPTGDLDPFVMRHYRYNKDSQRGFARLAIRSVCDDRVPVQFLLSGREVAAYSRCETQTSASCASEERRKLEELVPQETGQRLIKL
jgi:hypothetical protein